MLCKLCCCKCKNNRSYEEYEIDYEKIINDMKKENKKCILIDVRSPQEYKEGHLENSINIPFYDINDRIKKINLDKDTKIVVYCQTGQRSLKVIEKLLKKGYKNIYSLKGGIENTH